MVKYVEPSISLNAFNCPHCGAFANQLWSKISSEPIEGNSVPASYDITSIEEIDLAISSASEQETKRKLQLSRVNMSGFVNKVPNIVPFNFGIKSQFRVSHTNISQCYCCKKLSFWLGDSLLYPKINTKYSPNVDLSIDIQDDFNEAASILDKSPRGAAALLRLCIQKICKQVGKKGSKINEDIATLVNEGLDPRIQKALDIVRVTGNEAVHPGEMNLKDDKTTAIELFGLVNFIADTLITQPKKIDEMFDELPQSKKQAISTRDQKKESPNG